METFIKLCKSAPFLCTVLHVPSGQSYMVFHGNSLHQVTCTFNFLKSPSMPGFKFKIEPHIFFARPLCAKYILNVKVTYM